MNGGILGPVIKIPFTNPQNRPIAIDSIIANNKLFCVSCANNEHTTETNAICAPADKSTPPFIITSIIPIAKIPIRET